MENIQLTSVDKTMVVSSREIAKNFEKEHKHIIRDIDAKINSLETSVQNWTHLFMESKYEDKYGREQREYLLTRDGFSFMIMGFTGSKADIWKLKYIDAFNKMEQALLDIKFRVGDKKHQMECMELLHDILPEEYRKDKVNYIIANTVVNKCVSNIFGFPKMVSKGDMNQQMLDVRTDVLDDYIKLFEVYQDNSQVKSGLELKYKQLALETINK